MKKLWLFLLAGALTFALAACGGADKAATKATDDNQETATQTDDSTEATSASGAEEFTITAKNWEFSSDKELVIKKGTTVKLNLVNEEGVHTITNKELGIDLTVDKPAEFTADTTGEYELHCNQICGAMEDHEAMKITLKIVD
ncbi:MAG TPA: cupredoxin domain-containing protein [Pseudoneobacillus sp.]|nr:cupredoxin domain-containing protein [Pseudoneobacillus sp.]